MPASKRIIERSDILSPETYVSERKERRAAITALKKNRRVAVGPYATFYFENYDTMFQQIHEMLYIEKGGEEQIADELAAYNPLIPKGDELVATLMFEIDDEVRRDKELRRLTGVEDHIYIDVGGLRVTAVPEGDVERTKSDGKTSSVHFLHFPFKLQEVEKFRDPATQVIIAIAHPNYGHMALLAPDTRAALAADLD
ncbi:DUF3501 family protein [Parvibaculum sedimenti]|uniref:DUF3501 family protein n=1 Tax=Parvibaculum sedimenti TaxID=2608632 RepID=A0A6N6VN22_9HYPH|nr:DUF3501 family protein [Parvibaculum sedimenti]KAB7742617.1 DUF3501 family protein [Parvibaculum sedimenti]